MPQPRHAAIAAGLALTLTLGAAATPVYAADATVHASDANADGTNDGGTLPAPSDYDKDDFYTGDAASVTLMARSASSLSPVSLSDEMKYFCKYESSQNYDQGFSYGDGYNAMGYYQFDRRHALFGFLKAVYAYNPTTYAMFAGPISNEATLSSESYSTYDKAAGTLTPMAQELNDAWHAAYRANPTEFSALQDAYSYNTYYLPVRNLLKTKYGIDLDKRADCVKGLMWGLSNLFGYGGCQNYLTDAKISEDMTDEELVTAVCDTVVTRVTYYCSSQPQYWQGWQNRYRSEKATCLAYLAQHEADQGTSDDSTTDGGAAGGTTGGATDSGSSDQGDASQDTEAGGQEGSAGQSDTSQDATDEQGSTGQSGSGTADDRDSGTSDSQDSADSNGSGTSDDTVTDTGSDQQAGSQDQGSSNSGTAGDASSGTTTDAEQNDSAANGSGTSTSTPDAESDGQASSNGSSAGTSAGTGSNEQAGNGEATNESSTSASDETDASASAQGSSSNASSSTDEGSEKAASAARATASDASAQDSGSAAQTAAPTGGLPQTGDIAGLVMMGASGLGVAGASLVSLGKEKRARREQK